MIVYLESNFVLELAFLQAEHEHCSALLRLSKSGEIRLVLPAFSIGEPYETWVRRSKRRRDVHEELTTAIRELSRSSPYERVTDHFHELKRFRQSGHRNRTYSPQLPAADKIRRRRGVYPKSVVVIGIHPRLVGTTADPRSGSVLPQPCIPSSSGSNRTLSCSFGSVRAITAVQLSVSLALYGRWGTPGGM